MEQEQKKSKTFFVGIQNAQELRVQTLSASKETIKCLDTSALIAKRRDEKKKLLKKIRHDIVEIEKLLEKLSELLPKEKIMLQGVEEEPKRKELPNITRPIKSKNEKDTKKLKKLQKNIYELEEKINKI